MAIARSSHPDGTYERQRRMLCDLCDSAWNIIHSPYIQASSYTCPSRYLRQRRIVWMSISLWRWSKPLLAESKFTSHTEYLFSHAETQRTQRLHRYARSFHPDGHASASDAWNPCHRCNPLIKKSVNSCYISGRRCESVRKKSQKKRISHKLLVTLLRILPISIQSYTPWSIHASHSTAFPTPHCYQAINRLRKAYASFTQRRRPTHRARYGIGQTH